MAKIVGVKDLCDSAQIGVLIKRRFDADFISNQKKVETFVPVPRQRRTCKS